MNNINHFLGIDVGKLGAISRYDSVKKKMEIITVPDKVEDVADYFNDLKKTNENILACIEQVSIWTGDADYAGKVFRTQQMMRRYNEMTTILRLCKIPHVRVTPVEWQSYLNIGIGEKETYWFRKKRYYETAKIYFPNIGFTRSQADAVLLMYFLMKKCELDIDWIENKLPRNIFLQLCTK